MIPFPGTPDAAAATQVIFSALRPAELRSVTVTGSRSGRHKGRLEVLPAGAGTAFVPDHEFTPGETVVVSAALRLPEAGTASGDPGATHLRFSFGVLAAVHPLELATGRSSETGVHAQGSMAKKGHGPVQSFQSEPQLHPPGMTVTTDPDTTSGDIFLTPQDSPQVGPMILNSAGDVVWFHPLRGRSESYMAGNFAVQRYEGQPMLAWWQGRIVDGLVINPSEDVIMNRHYQRVAVVHAGYGDPTDLHDFQLTPQGTAYLDSYVLTKGDLTSVGGPASGAVADYIIQEIDVKTGNVLWEWHSLGHVPISASYQPYYPNVAFYDYFHLNAIQPLPNGNLLVSARDTCAVYEISRQTGKIIWTLGGKHSDFKLGPGVRFWWQHDARLNGHILSVFDDGSSPQKEAQSSAKFLNIDFAARTVSLASRYAHYPPALASAGGSTQALPNRNIFVGWGAVPDFSEFTPNGQMIFNGSFDAFRVVSYRAFRFPWVGEPLKPPSLAAAPSADGNVTAYASWNGATQVTGWRMLGGSTPNQLKPLAAIAPLTGFETTVDVASEPRYFAVEALNRNGRVLSTSRARPDPPHLAVFGSQLFVPTSGGSTEVPVGCLAEPACRVTVTIKSRGSVRGRSTPQVIPSERAGLVHLGLSPSGEHELLSAPGHRLAVQVIARSGSNLPIAKTNVTLIPYKTTAAVTSPTVGFVSSTGKAGVLTPCYAPVPCPIQETLVASGQVMGQTSTPVVVGANELAYVELQLNAAGRRMLAKARGNVLRAEIKTRTGSETRTQQIDLVAYG